MITISTLTPSDPGYVELDTIEDFRENSVRISRTKTLDGGVYINKGGFVDGDRTVAFTVDISEQQATDLWAIFRTETSVYISMPDGFYLGSIEKLKTDNGRAEIKILIERRESE